MLLQKFQSLWLISNRNLSKNFILFKHKQIPWMPLSADNWRRDFALRLCTQTLHSDFALRLCSDRNYSAAVFVFPLKQNITLRLILVILYTKTPEVFKTKTFCRDIKSMQMNHKGVDFGGGKKLCPLFYIFPTIKKRLINDNFTD